MATKNKNHDNFTSISIEKIILNTKYAFTYSPAHQCEDSYIDRLKAFVQHSKKTLHELKGSIYQLHLESSPAGILHWHGYIQIYDIRQWAVYDVVYLKKHGHVCIKVIESDDIWTEYITKQKVIWLTTIESLVWDNPHYKVPKPVEMVNPKKKIPKPKQIFHVEHPEIIIPTNGICNSLDFDN